MEIFSWLLRVSVGIPLNTFAITQNGLIAIIFPVAPFTSN